MAIHSFLFLHYQRIAMTTWERKCIYFRLEKLAGRIELVSLRADGATV